MNTLLPVQRSRSLIETVPVLGLPSLGAGQDSRLIEQRLRSMRTLMSSAVANLSRFNPTQSAQESEADKLRAKLTSFKNMTATIAMHLDSKWRNTLFATLDRLLDPNDWDSEFEFPSEESFSTFLRMIIYLHPTRRPGLGLSPNGRIIAAWRRGKDRIVIECMKNDEVRWVLSRTVEGERESGAGQVSLHRVPDVIAAYDPEELFTNGDKILA